MTQVNLTLSQEEVLQVITGDRDTAMKYLLEKILNEIMKAESEEQLGAAKHERTDNRQDYRNGNRERELNTRIGTITLNVPRHRNEPFHTMVFDNYQRSEASLIATMVQMVIAGVSTRKVERVVKTLCGIGFSKSTVSELCKRLDSGIRDFNERRLDDIDYPFLMVDATYFKARVETRIHSKAFLVALAFRTDGTREVVGFDVYDTEENYSWISFFNKLKSRGLSGLRMVISDAHPSIRKAIADAFPDAAWQRCQVHLQRNILDATPNKYKEGIKTELANMFNATTITEAERIKEELISDYSDIAPVAMDKLNEGFWDSMTVMSIRQKDIRVTLRTSNILERLNRELKRRSDVIQVFPNPESIMRLMGAVAIEYHNHQSTRQRLYSEQRYQAMDKEIKVSLTEIAKRQRCEFEAA
jgi:transposase-like protein